MLITPLDYYHEQIKTGRIFEDPQQLNAMNCLQRIFQDLLEENRKRSSLVSFLHSPQLIKGAYLWGGVGIGKTFMMDCFYHCLPFKQKMRMHFYQFMRNVHNALATHQGEADPLKVIAKELSQQTMVLCFDEFFVSDITDAMLLGRLFKALFARHVCLVATSNVAPDNLYKNGLQRSQFLPAIALLKEQTEVVHIPTVIDYRLRHLKEAGVFYTPLNADSRQKMEKSFMALTKGEYVDSEAINIQGRLIQVKKKSLSVVWFDFNDICSVPRSQTDYLAIAEKFRTVFISDIPAISSDARDTICLFISLIDVFYDARVRLVFSAAEPVEQIYSRGYMISEYTRINSRLLEMQSENYFGGSE